MDFDYLDEFENDEDIFDFLIEDDVCNISTEDESKYSSYEYCYNKCEFYSVCYANHEFCVKQTFEDVLGMLTPREEQIVKMFFGWDNKPELSFDGIAKEFVLEKYRIDEIFSRALRKLRHPSRSNKLKQCMYEAYTISNNSFYSKLLDKVLEKKDNHIEFELYSGIDYSIIYEDMSSNKSAVEIKSDLRKSVSDFDILKPYLTYLNKLEITSLDHLLHTSVSKLFFDVFKNNKEHFYDLVSALASMGYKIKGTDSAEIFGFSLMENLKSSVINKSIYSQKTEELPLCMSKVLFKHNITTIEDLLYNITSIYEIGILSDDVKRHIDDYLIRIGVAVTDDEEIIYLTPVFWNIYFNELLLWMKENSLSILKLKLEIEKTLCVKNSDIVKIIKEKYPQFNIQANVFTKSKLSIYDLDFSVRTFNYLRRNGIESIDDLLNQTPESISRICKFGKNVINEIIQKVNYLKQFYN